MSLRRSFDNSHNLLRGYLFLVINSRFRDPGTRRIPNYYLVRDTFNSRQDYYSFHVSRGLRFLSSSGGLGADLQKVHHSKEMEGKEDGDAVQRPIGGSATPIPRKPNFLSWRWFLGIFLSLVLPFWQGSWTKLLQIENEVEKVTKVVEDAAEVVETVATVAENLSTAAVDKLPDEGKLRDAVLLVKHVSEEAVKGAQLTEDFIHKVDEVKEEIEDLVNPKTIN
ncbi:hypothetical protein Syun_013549 [Stephania yunnanensis]|uniref:Uncharacterized protein n=1 Tax=Stephania yunnanensis TaxID=152371 RepID=A0AAP0JHT1_9MAGN